MIKQERGGGGGGGPREVGVTKTPKNKSANGKSEKEVYIERVREASSVFIREDGMQRCVA